MCRALVNRRVFATGVPSVGTAYKACSFQKACFSTNKTFILAFLVDFDIPSKLSN